MSIFGNSNEQKSSETQENTQNNTNNADVLEPKAKRQVLVTSRTVSGGKIVVIFKKIKPQVGPLRDAFNIYTFNFDGECLMPERDAILFWKDRRKMEGMEMDIAVYKIKMEGEEVIKKYRYKFNEVKDWYEVAEVSLSESSPQNIPQKDGDLDTNTGK